MTITKLNKNVANFTYEVEGKMDYRTLENLYHESGGDENKIYIIRGGYINEGRYGLQATLVTDEGYINLPKHLVDDVEAIRNDEGIIHQINEGRAGFKVYHYFNKKYNKDGYSINWVDVE